MRQHYKRGLRGSLYTVEQLRTLEGWVIESGVTASRLMRRAGERSLARLRERWPDAERIVVLCGGGNNGGDGLTLATAALEQKMAVRALMLREPQSLRGEAAEARDACLARGGRLEMFAEAKNEAVAADALVDAIFGIGFQGEARKAEAEAIEWLNAHPAPTLALDLPSGLSADSGAASAAVRADVTVSFIGLKRGLFTGAGADCAGEVVEEDLGAPSEVYRRLRPAARLIEAPRLRRRAADTHKGDYGHVLIVGGNASMSGAALLAGLGALRSGAGLTSLATTPDNAAALAGRVPELMVGGVRSGPELDERLEGVNALVVGPGLGRDAWAEQMLQQTLNSGLPMVMDADALRLMAGGLFDKARLPAECLMTPHPGEAAALLGMADAAEVQRDRFGAVERLAEEWGVVAVLKGCGSLVRGAGEETSFVCDRGNPGMAAGGMGDLLSGIMGALLAQRRDLRMTLEEIAKLAVLLHAEAGDRAAAQGQRGLLASDLAAHLPTLLESLSQERRGHV